MIKIPFENGVKSTNAYVTIDGINHDVTDAVYTGDTPLSAENLNQMQENIEQSTVAINSSEPTTSEKVWFKKGKNLIDLRNFTTTTIKGITFTNNNNGTVTLNGTSTEAFGISFFKYNFKLGTYSFNNKCDNQNVHLYFYSYDLLQTIIDENQTVTLTEEKNNVGLDTYIQAGETFNNAIIKPMLSLGNQQEFEPYVDNNMYLKNSNGEFEKFSETVIADSKKPNSTVWLKKGKNLVNKIIYGESFNEVINSMYKSSNWARTDFIEIELNVPYIFSHQLNTANGKIATFDKNYNWLGDINGEAILNSFTITNSNVKYVMVNVWFPEEITSINESWMQLEQNTTATSYEGYIEKEILVKNDNGNFEKFTETIITDNTKPNATVWVKKGKNLIDYSKLSWWKYIDSDGTLVDNDYNNVITDYIPVNPNTSYIFSHALGTALGRVCIYDKNKKYIGYINHDNITSNFTTNENTYYVIVGAWNGAGISPETETWMQLEQNTIATEPEAYIEKEILVKNDNGIYEQFYSEKQNLSYNMCENLGYFSTIDVNNVSKVGNLVQVTFRGLAGKDIPNNTGILRLPYGIAVQGMCLKVGIGQQYTYEEMRWGYANISTNNEIRIGGDVSTGRWIHIDFVYIANQ